MKVVDHLKAGLAAASQDDWETLPESPDLVFTGQDGSCALTGARRVENARLIVDVKAALPGLISAAEALAVMAFTPVIRAHLEATDPMALKQALAALAQL